MQQSCDLFANVPPPVSLAALAAAEEFGSLAGVEARGAVFTRREVVEFMLDLAAYTDENPLHRKRLLEPSFGEGSFLFPIVDRLLSSWRKHGGEDPEDLKDAIVAVELHRETFAKTRKALLGRLLAAGLNSEQARFLVKSWLIRGDFLLTSLKGEFDHVVGNPPYVRQELIPEVLLREYRARYVTIYDRADLYIPFIERSLEALAPGGLLSFICADRWMKNRYGGPLRSFVAERFHLRAYVDMVGSNAFDSDVVAYPAITLICREAPGATRIAHRPDCDQPVLKALAEALCAPVLDPSRGVTEQSRIVSDEAPWLIGTGGALAILRRLEAEFPLLEEAGCKVGIGVATGADRIFIGDFAGLEVEPECKLPLVMTRDIQSGEIVWRGLGVINPFRDDGGLVDLGEFPLLRRYLDKHREQIMRRHCAQKNPAAWFRTIDRICPALVSHPKLLIPDIKGDAHVVFDAGEYYPHHNLYHVTSGVWDLRALQAVLRSSVSRLFVSSYSTKMRGDFLRFQAQYLRRIRLPRWLDVPEDLRKRLRSAAIAKDADACNDAVCELYGFSGEERRVLSNYGE